MKSRNILILALVMALITTFLFNGYLKNLDKKYKKNQNKVTVVAAKGDIKKNQKVTSAMLQYKELSADSVQSEAVKKIQDIEGKYALADIRDGETLLPFRFTSQFEEEKQITRKIRDGFRAVSIEANFVESVSNLIQPEDYVDVVFSETLSLSGGQKSVNTILVLENIRVLAVGKSLKDHEVQSDNKKNVNDVKEEPGESLYTSVTLELKPEDAVKIINVDEKGSIKFILRSKVLPQ